MNELEKLILKQQFIIEQSNRLLAANPLVSEFFYYYKELEKITAEINIMQSKEESGE
jgi:hypothetical protein